MRSVALGRKSYGRTGASWAFFSRAPCSRPGFTLPGLTKQTEPQSCSSVRGLGLLSMHTTISRFRPCLAFFSGTQADSRSRPVFSPQERRGNRIPAHHPCTEMGCCGAFFHSFPVHTVPPRTLPHPGGRRSLSVNSFRELFLRVQGRRLVASHVSTGTGGQGSAVSLDAETQDRDAFCPESFLRVEHTPLPRLPLLSP